MMRLFFTILICTSCSSRFAGIDFDAARPIATISPQSKDFNDLDFLKNLLKNKRIVILGEDAHPNAAGFKAQHRMINFLTKEMGFTRVLFEYDMYPIWKGVDCYKKGMTVQKVSREFGRIQAFLLSERSDLFNDLLANENLIFGGYDIMYSGMFSADFGRDIEKIVNEMKTPLTENDQIYFNEFASATSHGEYILGYPNYSFERISKISALVIADLQSRKDHQWPEIYEQIIKNNIGLLKWSQSKSPLARRDPTNKRLNIRKYYKERDIQMAKNILWWLKAYPDEKFIIQSTDYHGARNLKFDSGVRTTIDLLTDNIPEDEIYMLANITYGGVFGYIKQDLKDFSYVRQRSIERKLHETNFQYLFLDFDETMMNRNRKFKMKSLRPLVRSKNKWGKAYDGFFFMNNGEPFTSQIMLPSDYENEYGPFRCN